MRRDDDAQVHVIEAIIVGILVFVAIAIAAVFRVPTIAGTFEQSELERLGTDVLLHLAASGARSGLDCNEAGKCPFESELERMLSLALRYEGPTVATPREPRDTVPFTDYFNQSLPDGARYILTYSNGVNATRIAPLGLTPPALDVVVAHSLAMPNWTAFITETRNSVLIQLNETTGFQDTTVTIRDPLNRDRDEWGGSTHAASMTSAAGTARIPVSAVYGTYQHCTTVPVCTYFTVVPPGVYGAGSSILLTDRDNSTNLRSGSPFFDLLKFSDGASGTPNVLDSNEPLYLDFNGNNQVNAGDLRLNDTQQCRGAGTPRCLAGTYVRTGEVDIGKALQAFPVSPRPVVRSMLGDDDDQLDEGELVYLDVNNNRVVDANDRRLSRVGTFRMGSEVRTGDWDVNTPLMPAAPTPQDFSATTIHHADLDADGAFDPEEPIYLDLVGYGQTAGIESLDLRLSPHGSPNVRYAYDVQAVIWFGI